VINWVKLTRV